MRHLKFILSALAILLTGALAAGAAARAVAAPRTGETVSVGVVGVPSVLGQTADEVLFYPWSLYESLTLRPSSPFWDDPDAEEPLRQEAEAYAQHFLGPFALLDADFDAYQAYRAVQYAFLSRSQLSLAFLKDFPAQAGDGTPLLLSFASSAPDGGAETSLSYLLRPQNSIPIPEERQAQALEQVRSDLRELLSTPELLDAIVESEIRGPSSPLFTDGEFSYVTPSGEARTIGNPMAVLMAGCYSLSRERGLNAAPLIRLLEALWAINGNYSFSGEPLEDMLAILDQSGIQIQLISTPDQVIVLFNCGSSMLGLYYDIQLDRYSGLGLSS